MGDKPAKRKFFRLMDLLLFGPFILALVSPLILLIIAETLPDPKPLDPGTGFAFCEWLDEEMLARYGPPSPKHFPTEIQKIMQQSFALVDPRFLRLYQFEMYGPALNSDLDAVLAYEAPVLDDLAALFATGHGYVSHASLFDGNQVNWGNATLNAANSMDYRLVYVCGTLRMAIAGRAASQGDWDEVLEQFRLLGEACESLRTCYVHGFYLADLMREILYDHLPLLLAPDVPPDVKRRAADWLARIRRSEPHSDAIVLLQENCEQFYTAMDGYRPGANHDAMILDQQVSGLKNQSAVIAGCVYHYSDPDRERYAADFIGRRRGLSLGDLFDHISDREPDPRRVYRFFEGCALGESFHNDWLLMNADFWPEQADPVTRFFLCIPSEPFAADVWRGHAIDSMRSHLAGLALAAQIMHTETGHWPESVDALAEVIPPVIRDEPMLIAANWEGRGFTRLTDELKGMFAGWESHLGWLEPSDRTIGALRGQLLPLDFLNQDCTTGTAYRAPGGEVYRVGRMKDDSRPTTDGLVPFPIYSIFNYVGSNNQDQLLKAEVFSQALQSHPALIDSVDLYWSDAPEAFMTLQELKDQINDLKAQGQYEKAKEFELSETYGDPFEPSASAPDMDTLQRQIANLYAAGKYAAAEVLENRLYYPDYSPSSSLIKPTTTGLVLFRHPTSEEFRAMMDARDLYQWTIRDHADLPPDKRQILNDPDYPEPRVVGHLFLDIQWKTPTRIFAAWNNGPDGDDDGGQVAYDPTNGTVSNGDLIQFIDYQ